MQVGNRAVNTSHPATGRSEHPWIIQLEDQRSDSETIGIHIEVAKALGMDPMSDVRGTIGSYVRGDAGEAPPRADLLIDPMQRELLHRHGVDPVRLLHIRHLGLGFTVVVLHGPNRWETSSVDDDEAPYLSGVTFMAPGIRHFADGKERSEVSILESIHGAIPDTAAGALVGRPLSELLDHGLDADPVVTNVNRLGPQTIVGMRTEEFVSIRGR